MHEKTKISKNIQNKLICPHTKTKLQSVNGKFESSARPGVHYPVIDGIPVLISDEKSLFSIEDFETKKDTTFELKKNKLKDFLNGLIPTVSINFKSKSNYKTLSDLLSDNSTVLVVGGSIRGEGMDAIFSRKNIDVVSSDVSFGPYTTLICDSHDIPIEDNTFDCVIVQAVLEHVLDPTRCVSEIHRVMKDNGVVYAETPFMQQVHEKQFDFTRFTHLGHRRLFRHFEEIDSGPIGGPGMALAWSWVYLFRSFTTNRWASRILSAFAHLTSFFWKYLDYFIVDTPGGYDAASGFYFLGRKAGTVLSDKNLIEQFRGIP